VRAALGRHGVQPHLLEIEITVGAAAADIPGTAAQLRELMKVGVGVALNNYGTEYYSLAMLRDLRLTTLKIDKSFIDRIDTDPVSAKIVAGVINTAKALGLRTTAEGVERETQLAVLRDLACDTAQGSLISHAVPAGQIS
jgi:EAL domain-containing protein (putative c-di-GMP-specific phosphodiesterase class I)